MESFRGNFKDWQSTIQLNGVYRGIVEDKEDPLRMGRVRVRVFGIHTAKLDKDDNEGIPIKELPWAEQVAPILGGSSGAGSSAVPLLGTIVYVFFEKGDPLHPKYFGIQMGMTAPQSNDKTNPTGTSQHSSDSSVGAVSTGDAAKDICELAKKYNIPPCRLEAFRQIESSGSGWLTGVKTGIPEFQTNQPKIAFEPAKFYTNLKNKGMGAQADAAYAQNSSIATPNKPVGDRSSPGWQSWLTANKGNQTSYNTLEEAMKIDKEAALASCSYGAYQIGAWQYKGLGYNSVDEFMKDATDPAKENALVSRFIDMKDRENKGALTTAIRDGDYHKAASLYNGKYYNKDYPEKMKKFEDQCEKDGKLNEECKEGSG